MGWEVFDNHGDIELGEIAIHGTTIRLNGADGTFADQAYTIVLAAAESDDPDYGGLDPTDVSVTNKDNEKDKPPKNRSATSSRLLAACVS